MSDLQTLFLKLEHIYNKAYSVSRKQMLEARFPFIGSKNLDASSKQNMEFHKEYINSEIDYLLPGHMGVISWKLNDTLCIVAKDMQGCSRYFPLQPFQSRIGLINYLWILGRYYPNLVTKDDIIVKVQELKNESCLDFFFEKYFNMADMDPVKYETFCHFICYIYDNDWIQ